MGSVLYGVTGSWGQGPNRIESNNEPGYEEFTRKVYVVVDDDDKTPFEPTTRALGVQSISCKSCKWASVIPADGSASELVTDLLSCLSSLGISSLKLRRFKNMKNGEYTRKTAAMHQLIQLIGRIQVGDEY